MAGLSFRDTPLRTKLRLLVLAISVAAVAGSCAVFIAYLWFSTRASMVRRQEIMATIVADQTIAAVEFNQPVQAATILATLKAERQIVAAAIYTPEGRLFASFLRAGAVPGDLPARPGEDGQRFVGGELLNFHAILSSGERVGTLHIRSDLTDLRDRILVVLGTAILVLMGASIIVLAATTKLAGLVTEPVIRLAEFAQSIAARKDYAVRMEPGGKDEAGRLIEAFNEMLAQIQSKDSALASARDDLEIRVRERTRELETEVAERKEAERRVLERTRELEVANKDLEGFSYSVSHDLRAPLRAIDGYSRMLIEDFGDKAQGESKRYLDVIVANTRRMSQLIDDLLAFAKLGRKTIDTAPIDMEILIREVVADQRQQLSGRDVDIRIAPLPPARGDVAMFRQVFANLVSNAIKYTRGRSPAIIEIGAQVGDSEAVYSIKDNGVGFEMQFAHKLFGVFQRLHSQKEFEGTGVGLALVARIVQRHGGRVWADGKVGSGATFFVALPKEPAGTVRREKSSPAADQSVK